MLMKHFFGLSFVNFLLNSLCTVWSWQWWDTICSVKVTMLVLFWPGRCVQLCAQLFAAELFIKYSWYFVSNSCKC